ncbi:hypothetical protein BJF77_04530 [Kocuria sp. CNJ-770]|nr:hypothetical protein BJF77_04530 [Kocuria sp. CNJ-770]
MPITTDRAGSTAQAARVSASTRPGSSMLFLPVQKRWTWPRWRSSRSVCHQLRGPVPSSTAGPGTCRRRTTAPSRPGAARIEQATPATVPGSGSAARGARPSAVGTTTCPWTGSSQPSAPRPGR